MSEAISIVRILVRGGLVTLWPWLILTISFIVNLAFFAAVGDDAPVVLEQLLGLQRPRDADAGRLSRRDKNHTATVCLRSRQHNFTKLRNGPTPA